MKASNNLGGAAQTSKKGVDAFLYYVCVYSFISTTLWLLAKNISIYFKLWRILMLDKAARGTYLDSIRQPVISTGLQNFAQ